MQLSLMGLRLRSMPKLKLNSIKRNRPQTKKEFGNDFSCGQKFSWQQPNRELQRGCGELI